MVLGKKPYIIVIMIYIKLTNNQIQTLKNLPNNLNDSLCCNSICGIIILTKSNEFKQIIMDFQSSSLEEFYTKKKNIHILNHIRNPDPRNNYVFTFEIINILTNIKSSTKLSDYNIPGLNQWIKCAMNALYRKVFTHILFTPSDKIYSISIKKTYYYEIVKYKTENKVKMKDMFHYLFKSLCNLYQSHTDSLKIPDIFNKLFNIKQFNNNQGIMFEYIVHNTLLAEVEAKKII